MHDVKVISPGEYIQPNEDELQGFKARLNERLAPIVAQQDFEENDDWRIGDTLAQWWRPNFETFLYPFIPPHITRPKECKKLYLVHLPQTSEYSAIEV